MQLKQILTSIAATLLLGSVAYATDTYNIDPAHTSIGFSVRHLGLNNVKGQFKEFAGAIVLERFRRRVWIQAFSNGTTICEPRTSSMPPITRRSRSRPSASRRLEGRSS